jgi:poly(3-hydroxybutyrate) depolymerase
LNRMSCMLYSAFQAQADMMEPVRWWARMGRAAYNGSLDGLPPNHPLRNLSATYEMIDRATLTHTRPAFGIDSIKVGNREVAIVEEAAHVTPFATLLRFKKDIDTPQPRVLLVAPMSGHFATLLRATVRTLLPEHDVYITDWHNARDVPIEEGRFALDDYVGHLITFLEQMGPGAHVVAVCQPCVQALAAAAIMGEDDNPAAPKSMTLMAGPVDTRVNPTTVNVLAKGKPIKWFEDNLISTVPWPFKGRGRKVYPGFVQLTAFMNMNMDRHVKAHQDMWENLARGETEKAAVTKAFYDEYFAVLDLAAEFYLETVRLVFQEHALPLGELEYKGRKVDPSAVRRTALLTVEGERDDICAVGQTVAAHELCSRLRPYRKRHHMQPGVGHYGVFSGKRWEAQVYPLVRNLILASD